MNFSKKNHSRNFGIKQKIIRRRKTLKKGKNLILLLIVLSLNMVSCKSDDNEDIFIPTLPPITQTGANTFGCYIEGKLLTPRNGTGYYGGTDRGIIYSGLGDAPNYLYNELNVHDFKSRTNGIMDIHFVNLHENGEGIFDIEESNCEKGLAANTTLNIRCRMDNKWYCSIENTGTLSITRYDYENRIFSGTFSCKAVNRDNPQDVVEITQGRFDIKWDTLIDANFP